MSDPNKLFQKADALLGRYRGDSKTAQLPDFPVLTEVVETPSAPVGLPVAQEIAAVPVTFTERELHELETRVHQQISRFVPSLLEETIPQVQRERVEEIVSRALAELAEATRSDMESRLMALVSGALRTAILELREARDPEGR